MAANTTLEALTAELLGDVGKLHDTLVKLPVLIEPATKSLELQVGYVLTASAKFEKTIGTYSDKAARNAAGMVEAAVTQAAVEAAKRAVGEEVKAASSAARDAADKLARSAGQIEAAIASAHREKGGGSWWAALGGGFIAAAVVMCALRLAGLLSPSPMTEAVQTDVNNGRNFAWIYKKMTPKEQQRIQELLKTR